MPIQALISILFAALTATSVASILPRQQTNTSDASRCASFVLPLSFPEDINATLTNATWYPAGSNINLSDAYSTLRTSNVKDFCRLQLDIHTFSGSQAKSEVWLPAVSAWNGRFMGIGNGASAGGVEWSQLAFSAVGEGFAGHSTNTGHSSNSSAGSWASITQAINLQTVLSGVNGVAYSNSATNPDIRPFVERGGKIVQYVGWNDKYISPYASIDWVTSVDRYMTTNSNYTTSDYLRLFIVPGMGHCSGGAGPNALGQSGSYGSATEIARDPQYNMMYSALNWRENGTAPVYFIGTSFNNNNRSLGTGYQRPICQYPQWTRYNGNGNVSLASSFSCVL